jgi:hypothetical protein
VDNSTSKNSPTSNKEKSLKFPGKKYSMYNTKSKTHGGLNPEINSGIGNIDKANAVRKPIHKRT